MRVLEVRRHSYTKKGPGRGSGSHLSQDGVALARRVGAGMGPFDRIVASPVPRAAETALAMGFAVDELCEALGPSDPALFAEIGHHERWSWDDPFAVFARLVHQDGPTARLGRMVAEAWRSILGTLPENGRALAISHGRVIECGLVASLPMANHAVWGAPFRHCEGVRVIEDGGRELQVEMLRVELGERRRGAGGADAGGVGGGGVERAGAGAAAGADGARRGTGVDRGSGPRRGRVG